MIGFGKPKLYTKFEVALFSHCENIEGEPPNFGKLLYPNAMSTVSSACDFFMALANPSRLPNLKSLTPAVAEIL